LKSHKKMARTQVCCTTLKEGGTDVGLGVEGVSVGGYCRTKEDRFFCSRRKPPLSRKERKKRGGKEKKKEAVDVSGGLDEKKGRAAKNVEKKTEKTGKLTERPTEGNNFASEQERLPNPNGK